MIAARAYLAAMAVPAGSACTPLEAPAVGWVLYPPWSDERARP